MRVQVVLKGGGEVSLTTILFRIQILFAGLVQLEYFDLIGLVRP